MDIVYLDFSHPSFNWANGLYIVVSIDLKEKIYNLCKINKYGQPEMNNGEFSISCTGLNNPDVKKTNLKYFTDKQIRAEKLKKINEYGR